MRIAAVVGVTLLAAGCATTGATLGSGTIDTLREHPPYYAGATPPSGSSGPRIGYLPVAYQRGASQPAIFDVPEAGPVRVLLGRLTASLESLAVGPLLAAERGTAMAGARVPPDVRFGCTTGTGAPEDDCAERDEEEVLGREGQWMQLSVGRPSGAWTEWVAGEMAEAEVDLALVVTLEVGQYLPRQRGLRGTKILELGTGYTQELPWLTSLETPLSVLQLTGALVTPDGKAVRIGAEGLIARRTPLPLSAVGAQALIREEDVERLLTERREDLPGAALVWEAGLHALVEGLVGR